MGGLQPGGDVVCGPRPGALEARAIARELDPAQAGVLLRRLDAVGRRMQEAWADISFVLVGLQHLLGKEYRELGLLRPGDSET